MIDAIEPGTPDEEFERLRQRFHLRLRKEQAQLSALAEALGKAKIAPVSILVEIRAFAHRLCGAALVFGFQGIGETAKAVEAAAIAASTDVNGQRGNQAVAATLQALAGAIDAAVPPARTTYSTGSASRATSW